MVELKQLGGRGEEGGRKLEEGEKKVSGEGSSGGGRGERAGGTIEIGIQKVYPAKNSTRGNSSSSSSSSEGGAKLQHSQPKVADGSKSDSSDKPTSTSTTTSTSTDKESSSKDATKRPLFASTSTTQIIDGQPTKIIQLQFNPPAELSNALDSAPGYGAEISLISRSMVNIFLRYVFYTCIADLALPYLLGIPEPYLTAYEPRPDVSIM